MTEKRIEPEMVRNLHEYIEEARSLAGDASISLHNLMVKLFFLMHESVETGVCMSNLRGLICDSRPELLKELAPIELRAIEQSFRILDAIDRMHEGKASEDELDEALGAYATALDELDSWGKSHGMEEIVHATWIDGREKSGKHDDEEEGYVPSGKHDDVMYG